MGLKKFFLKFLCHVVLSVALVFVIWFALLLAATSTSAILPANQAENDVANWLDTLDVHQEITPSELPPASTI